MNGPEVPPLLAQLSERLQEREGLELEFKSVRGGLPRSLWQTVSAFANTSGGWIVLGVAEQGGALTIEGVANPNGLVQTFHDQVRNAQKISQAVCGPADATKVLVNLRDRGLLHMVGWGRGARYQLSAAASAEVEDAAQLRRPFLAEQAPESGAAGGGAVPSIGGSRPSLGGIPPSLGGSEPNLLGDLGPGLATARDELLALARPVRERRHVDVETRDTAIVALCARSALSIRELAELLGRRPEYLRDVIGHLVAAGRLRFQHPDRHHPQQRYVAVQPETTEARGGAG